MNVIFSFFQRYRIEFYLFVFSFCCYLFLADGVPWYESDLQVPYAINLFENFSLGLNEQLHPGFRKGINGLHYDVHGLVNIFLFQGVVVFLPVIKLFAPDHALLIVRFLCSFTNTILSSVNCLLLFSIGQMLGLSKLRSFVATLLLGFTVYTLPYSNSNYEEIPFIFFIILSFYLLMKYRIRESSAYLFILGFSITMTLHCRDFGAVFTAVFMSYLCFVFVFRESKYKQFLKVVAGGLLPLIGWLVYNYFRTGNPFFPPMVGHVGEGVYSNLSLNRNPWEGIAILFIGPGSSFFLYSPIFLLTFFVVKDLWKTHRTELVFSLIYISVIIIACSRMQNVYGLFGWGPRYLLSLVGVLALPVFIYIQSRGIGRSVKILGALGLLINISGALTNWHYQVIELKLDDTIYWSLSNAQHWNAIKGLFVNLQSMITGSEHILVGKFAAELSKESLYMTNTFYVWWTRIFLMANKSILVFIIPLVFLVTAVVSLLKIKVQLVKSNE